MKTRIVAVMLIPAVFALTLLQGCDKSSDASKPNESQASGNDAAAFPGGLFVAVEPANAKSVEDVKSASKTGDQVVIRGRVGGSNTPFVEGRAVFTLMGNGLKACSDNADDECSTPWDYCCDTAVDIAKHSVTVQVVDAKGAPVKANIKGNSGIKELSELVIAGKVATATDKVMIINASAIYPAKP